MFQNDNLYLLFHVEENTDYNKKLKILKYINIFFFNILLKFWNLKISTKNVQHFKETQKTYVGNPDPRKYFSFIAYMLKYLKIEKFNYYLKKWIFKN